MKEFKTEINIERVDKVVSSEINGQEPERKSVSHERNYLASRDKAHTTLTNYLRNHPEATYDGHPDNFMTVISRVCPKPGEFRSLAVIKVKGGGVLIQSSWRECGMAPSGHIEYCSDLTLEKSEYTDLRTGEDKLGYVLAVKSEEAV